MDEAMLYISFDCRVLVGITENAVNRCIHLGSELIAQSWTFLVIVYFRVVQV